MDLLRPLVAGLAGGLVATALLSWALASRRAPTEGLVAYSPRMRALALFMLSVALFIAYAALFASPDQRPVAWSLAGFFVVGGIWFVLETFLVRIEVTDTHLEVSTPWRASRRIRWSAVTGCAYQEGSQVWVLEAEGLGRVRLSGYLSGLEQVVERCGGEGPHREGPETGLT